MGMSNTCSHRVRNGATKMHETTLKEGRRGEDVKEKELRWML